MHNDQLQDYSKFPDSLPPVVSTVGFACSLFTPAGSLKWILHLNHSVIELGREGV